MHPKTIEGAKNNINLTEIISKRFSLVKVKVGESFNHRNTLFLNPRIPGLYAWNNTQAILQAGISNGLMPKID